MKGPRQWRAEYVFPFLLAAAIAITFSPCLHNGFSHYDDNVYLTENPLVRSLSPANIGLMFSTIRPHAIYAPLVTLSYAVEYKIWGMNPFGYHLTNLLLHMLNAILLFFFIQGLFSGTVTAFFTSLLFALHPLRVESVAWITERKDLLFAFFFLSALLLYLKYLKKKRTLPYLLSLGLFICSVLSKTTAFVFPFIVILLDWLVDRRISRKAWLEKTPFLLIAGLTLLITSGYMDTFTTGAAIQPGHVVLHNLIRSAPFYLQKTILPTRLALRYPTDMRFFMPPLWISLLFTFSLIAGTFLILRKHLRQWLWGWGFFFIALLPVFGTIRLFFPVADRYSYLPSMGLSFIPVFMIAVMVQHSGKLRPFLKPLTVTLGVFLLSALAAAGFQRCRIWNDDLALWNDVIDKYPLSPVAFHNRANLLEHLGRTEEAVRDYTTSIRLLPDSPDSYWNRGLARLKQGEYNPADTDFSRAIERSPGYFRRYYQLMMSVQGRNGLDSTLKMGESIITRNPSAEIHGTLAEACIRLKLWEKAMHHLQEAMRLSPDSSPYLPFLEKIRKHGGLNLQADEKAGKR